MLAEDSAVPLALASTAIQPWYGAIGSCHMVPLPGGGLWGPGALGTAVQVDHCPEESELILGDKVSVNLY